MLRTGASLLSAASPWSPFRHIIVVMLRRPAGRGCSPLWDGRSSASFTPSAAARQELRAVVSRHDHATGPDASGLLRCIFADGKSPTRSDSPIFFRSVVSFAKSLRSSRRGRAGYRRPVRKPGPGSHGQSQRSGDVSELGRVKNPPPTPRIRSFPRAPEPARRHRARARRTPARADPPFHRNYPARPR